VVSLLADPRTDVNEPETTGGTPFYLACQEGHQEVVTLLLADKRVDVNKLEDGNASPFSMACVDGHREVVSLLLADMRVDINKATKTQCTPLWFASLNGHLPIIARTRVKEHWESEENFTRIKGYGPLITYLIDSFDLDPATTCQQLRELPDLRDPSSATSLPL